MSLSVLCPLGFQTLTIELQWSTSPLGWQLPWLSPEWPEVLPSAPAERDEGGALGMNWMEEDNSAGAAGTQRGVTGTDWVSSSYLPIVLLFCGLISL